MKKIKMKLALKLVTPEQLLFLAFRDDSVLICQFPGPEPAPKWKAWLASWLVYGGFPGQEVSILATIRPYRLIEEVRKVAKCALQRIVENSD